jgi:UDP-2,4-diacetamido-2,4,6-trideoxy-beta-L-altropyranose hydrolase
MTVLIRCNASTVVGYGHLTRCRALAQALRRQGYACVMVGPDTADARPEDQDIFSDWIPVPDWPSANDDANRLVDLARRLDACWAVLDDYRVDESYQLTVRAAGLRWVQFDGTARKPLWADLIVNANPAAHPEAYANVLRNPETQLLLGPRYAILRPEFASVAPRDPPRPVKRILVTFGGGDDRGAIKFVLSTLLPETPSSVDFLVISGSRNPSNPSLVEWVEAYGQHRVNLHIDPPQVAPLFMSCDLAIMAGGMTTYEAACCGLPMILIAVADNQLAQSLAWASQGAAIHLGSFNVLNPSLIKSKFRDTYSDASKLLNLAKSASMLIDAHGANRVAKTIIEKTLGET